MTQETRRARSEKNNYKSFHSMLEDMASRFPDKTFVESIDGHKSITYGQMYDICNQIGNFLKEKGVKANDRIALLAENTLENLIVFMGILGYGAVFCPINLEINEKIVQDLINRINPRMVLWDKAVEGLSLDKESGGEWIPLGEWDPGEKRDKENGVFFSLLDRHAKSAFRPPVCNKGDLSIIIHTSGTTAKPKGVAYTHHALFCASEGLALMTAMGSQDRILEYRSFSWASAQILGFLSPLCAGATVVMAKKFSQSRFFNWLKDFEITIAVGIPTVINMLLARQTEGDKAAFPRLKYMTSSTAPLNPAQHLEFEEKYGIKIVQLYGMSEGGWIAGNHPEKRKIGTVGQPIKYQDVRIVGKDGRLLEVGTVGEIEIGGEQRAYGYLNEDGVLEPFGDERLKTGDLGFMDEEGFLHITGREKDLIIRGGVNIASLEIDNILLEHSGVAEAATIGVPDPIYGEEVVSCVVCKTGTRITADSLFDHCRLKLPDYKVPREILFLESIPKTERGKINRNALLEKWKQTHNMAAS